MLTSELTCTVLLKGNLSFHFLRINACQNCRTKSLKPLLPGKILAMRLLAVALARARGLLSLMMTATPERERQAKVVAMVVAMGEAVAMAKAMAVVVAVAMAEAMAVAEVAVVARAVMANPRTLLWRLPRLSFPRKKSRIAGPKGSASFARRLAI